jgi:hypothetical protein
MKVSVLALLATCEAVQIKSDVKESRGLRAISRKL